MLQPNLGQQIQVYVQFTGNEKSSPTISQQGIFDLDIMKMKTHMYGTCHFFKKVCFSNYENLPEIPKLLLKG